MRDEPIRHPPLLMEQSDHPELVDQENRGRCDGRGAGDPHWLTGEASFTEEIGGPEHRHDGFPARLGAHRELDASFVNVHDMAAGVALREDRFSGPVLRNASRNACRVEERLSVECGHN